MSDMVQKLEQEKTDKTSTNAKCNYNWFLENLIGKMKVTKTEMGAPSEVEIYRATTKKTELWVKVAALKGGDVMLEKKGEWPTNE